MARQLASFLHRWRRAVLLACIGMWVIAAIATHVPSPELSGIDVSDKTLHLIGYFVLAGLFWLSLTAHGMQTMHRIPMVLGIMMVYAAVDETTQKLVNRHAALDDWFADVIGTLLAVGVLELVFLIAGKFSRPPHHPPSS